MGAWIEIKKIDGSVTLIIVAPLVGAWIEILLCPDPFFRDLVAPLVGAWIEINGKAIIDTTAQGRSPRGSVD